MGPVLLTDDAGDGLADLVEPTLLGSVRERWFVSHGFSSFHAFRQGHAAFQSWGSYLARLWHGHFARQFAEDRTRYGCLLICGLLAAYRPFEFFQ